VEVPRTPCGQILRVDLSSGAIRVEPLAEREARAMLGGGGLAAALALRTGAPESDPLGPDNVLIFAPGGLAGLDAPGVAKHAVLAKSPLTGGVGETQCEGWWGPELKRAGFDALVVEGVSARPVWLHIGDSAAELRPADDLWGLEVGAATDAVLAACGDPDTRVATIGPAGERGVRYASIVNDYQFVSHRMGLGAVMGAKRLKAVAVRGTQPVQAADPERVREIAERFARHFMENPVNRLEHDFGLGGEIGDMQDYGMLPAHNWRNGVFAGWAALDARVFVPANLDHRVPCYACPNDCRKMLCPIQGSYEIDPRYGAPELEALTALGVATDVGDLPAVMKAWDLCQRYGLDAVSTGGTIAFAMECVERGLLGPERTGDLALRFGHGADLVAAVEAIGARRGFGAALGEGSLRLARELGPAAEQLAVQGKGKEFYLHDPRAKAMLGLGYAVHPTGPDFRVVEHDTDFDFQAPQLFMDMAAPLGILDRLEPTRLDGAKVRLFYTLWLFWSMFESSGACVYAVAPVRWLPIPDLVTLAEAGTGWHTSLWELMQAGERRLNLLKLFNLRAGFGPADDWLPERMFEPIANGPLAGQRIDPAELRAAIDLLYGMGGWDAEGRPTPAKLAELGLEWAAIPEPATAGA
jgi:aldehyde:ferredoxin oxidoreductase